MRNKMITQAFAVIFAVLCNTAIFAQGPKPGVISGTVLEATTNQPLEFASVYAENENNSSIVSGGMTDEKGVFSFDVPQGNYLLKIDFLGYKPLEMRNIKVSGTTNVGVLKVQDDVNVMDDIIVIAQTSTVDIKLDKKVYSVGQDMIVKGGTAGDVLDNVPSITVDSEGSVSLRGNENVKVLIDGKPSGLANNIQEAMRIIPAESIDKVEVITNPSARYEAEGGAGIINIVLRKGKSQGVNGNVTATLGDPRNYELNGNFNLRSEKFNFYTTIGYRDGKSEGYSLNNSEYFDTNGNTTQFIDEYKDNNRHSQNYNALFGLDYYITPTLTWSNSVSIRRNNSNSPNVVNYQYYGATHDYLYDRYREENSKSTWNSVEYTTSFEKQFSKPDHKLTVEASISQDRNNDNTHISDVTALQNKYAFEKNQNDNDNLSGLVKVDYQLPIGDSGQFEAGYLGTFKSTNNAYDFYNQINNQWVNNNKYSNTLEYKEQVNAFYAQYGDKITSRLNYMVGLRWEKSNIDVNQLRTQDFNNKKYDDFFPSAFLNYELNESSSLSVSYSRRIMRPRGRFLNPFSNYTSDINYFQGNPNLNPAKTDAFDLGFIKRWSSFTLSTSAYINKTDDTFQFVKHIAGTTDSGTPISVSSPINLATEYRYGLDFTLNYSPFKWWRLNGNFNFYKTETKGDYTFTDLNGVEITQNFDNNAYAWFTRVSSKVTLPAKISWQLNGMYRAPFDTAQGRSSANLSANTSLSKDFLKDKATIVFNVSDIFNSRKRESDTFLPQAFSHSEMQWRGRQINLSVTYRFNQKKTDKQRPSKGDPSDSSEMEMM